MSLLYTETKNNYKNNANAFEQFYSQQNKNKEIANTNLPAGDSWNKGAPYADSTPSTVASSPTPVTVNTTKSTSKSSSNSTPLVGFSKNPQQSYSYVNAYTPSTKKTTTPATSSQTTPITSSTGGDKTNTPSTQGSSLTKDPTTGIVYKADGTIYSQPSIYNPYGQNGALAKSEAAKVTGALDATTRKALEGIASWSDPEYVEYAKSLAGGDPEKLKSIESDYNAAILAAQELKYWDDLAKEKEKKISLADLMALFNDADNYTEWLNKYGTDTEAARAEAYKNRMAEFDRNRSTYGRNAENLAQLGLTNSGYSDYLDGVGYAAYIAGLSDADSQKAMQDAEYARQYAIYLSEKQTEAKQQALSLYGSVMSGELTPEQAMQYAQFLGLSDEDAQAIYDMANTAASTVTPSNTNAELNTMSTNVLSVMKENGYGVDTAIKMLYPDATADQITHIKQYVSDVEGAYQYDQNQALLKDLDTSLNTISQNITYQNGQSDIGSYEAKFNEIVNSGADTATIESAKEKISSKLFSTLQALYDDVGKGKTYLASYIKSAYGNEEDDSGMTAYNALTDNERDEFINNVIDNLYNSGKGILEEEQYNELKYTDFKNALESSKSMQEIAELALKVESGLVGTSSITEKELDELSLEFENVYISAISNNIVYFCFEFNGQKRYLHCGIKQTEGDKIEKTLITPKGFNFKMDGDEIYITDGSSSYKIKNNAISNVVESNGAYKSDGKLSEESVKPFVRLLARRME